MPEDISPLPPSDDRQSHRNLKWSLVVLIVALVLALVVMAPLVMGQITKARQTSAQSNLLQIGFCLYEFESQYGRFPDSVTAAEIKRQTRTPLTLSDKTSNDVFVQLLASGIAQSEPFFATHTSKTRKPDGNWSSDTTALESGETGFAYVSGLSAKDYPACPLVFGPVTPGSKSIAADEFDRKAVFLKMDNSVSSFQISSKDLVLVNGIDILDPAHPIWAGKPPVVKWPK